MRQFNRNLLPTLGFSRIYFRGQRQAEQFARWAERITKHNEHPCTASVERRPERPVHERFVVFISNW